MTNQEIHEQIVSLKEEMVLDNFVLNKQNKEYAKKIQSLRALCTHKNNNTFALDDKGYCIFCGEMVNDCN